MKFIKLKKCLSMLLILSLIFSGQIFISFLGIVKAEGVTLYEDDFENGSYMVADGMNGTNQIKTVTKGSAPQWVFEKKSGASFSGWSNSLVTTGPGSGDSTVLQSGAAMGSDTVLYYNLPKVYTKGILTVDMKVRRPTYLNGHPTRAMIMLYDKQVTNYSNLSNRALQTIIETNSSAQTRIAYANEYGDQLTKNTVWTSRVSNTTWWTFRYIVDLNNKTIQLLRNSSGGDPTDWATINFAAIEDTTPYTMANSIGSIVIRGIMEGDSANTGGNVYLDNMKITYDSGANLPEASNLTINGNPVVGQQLTASYDYFHADNIPEKNSVCTWYSSDNITYTQNNKQLKAAINDFTYTIVPEDKGKYIYCTIQPCCDSDENSQGKSVTAYMEAYVRSTITEPAITIMTPGDGDQFVTGGNVNLTVAAQCLSGEISKVEYYANGSKIKETSISPYSYLWMNIIKGTYSIFARAYNNLGESMDSQPITISVLDNQITYAHIGDVHKRNASEITSDNWSIGCETLDRDYAVYNNYKNYLGLSGAKRMRIQGGWAKCEKVKGEYDWAWLDEIVNDAVSQGVHPWINTCYGNTIYTGGGGTTLDAGLPTSTEALAAWDNWVLAMVNRYKDKVNEWEIWNEADHGTVTLSEYTTFFIRTSDLIRSVQPEARIIGLAAASAATSFTEDFLNRLKTAGKLGNLDVITVHGYPTNPDSNNYKSLKASIAKYSSSIELWAGESGAPDRKGGVGALSGWNSSQLKQQKWTLRRMLCARANDVLINVFTLVDLKYGTEGYNYKGLITINSDMTVNTPKPAYGSYQNVTSIFDDKIEVMPNYSYTMTGSDSSIALSAYQNRNTGGQLVVVWMNGGEPSDSLTTTPMTFTFPQGNFSEPAYVDLRDGKVYAIADWKKSGSTYTFSNVPIYDSPILIADKSTFQYDPQGIEASQLSLYGDDGVTPLGGSLSGIGTITAKGMVSSGALCQANLNLIVALYDDSNKVIGLSLSQMLQVTGASNGLSISAVLPISDEMRSNAKKVKVFVWNQPIMQPCASVYEKILSVN